MKKIVVLVLAITIGGGIAFRAELAALYRNFQERYAAACDVNACGECPVATDCGEKTPNAGAGSDARVDLANACGNCQLLENCGNGAVIDKSDICVDADPFKSTDTGPDTDPFYLADSGAALRAEFAKLKAVRGESAGGTVVYVTGERAKLERLSAALREKFAAEAVSGESREVSLDGDTLRIVIRNTNGAAARDFPF